ncbi:MAG: Holliday junction branch migration protein RuvA, partial [Elusimicrobiota bacterium]
MYAFLRGKVAALYPGGKNEASTVWLDVGGVGFQVVTAESSVKSLRRGDDATFYVCQSSALYGGETTLYGFLSLEDKELFNLIRELPAVGAKKALEYFEKIKSKSPQRFLEALMRQDAKFLSVHFGFSPKTTVKMTTQLKDKAQDLMTHWHAPKAQEVPSRQRAELASDDPAWVDGMLWSRARDALLSLGFDARSCEGALNAVVAKIAEGGC